MAEGKKGFELGTLLMVLVLLCILVAGLWMTGKALDSRLDALEVKLIGKTEQIQSDIDKLRKEILAVRMGKARATLPAAPPAAEEAPAKQVR
jgi:outer membrane murein-binding lipoprotein Lpp